jgi:hypothetical protein
MTQTTNTTRTYGKLVWDALDGRWARYGWNEGSAVVLLDKDTMKPLADYRHPTQVEDRESILY